MLQRLTSFTALLVLLVPAARAQKKSSEGLAAVQGTVFDSQNRPLAGVTISLESRDLRQSFFGNTDAQGHYGFAGLPNGTYLLRANMPGYRERTKGPLLFKQNESMKLDLQLEPEAVHEPNKDTGQAIEYADEPQFTVTGVSDPSHLGGHGSDVVLRSKEALAKDIVSLNRDRLGSSNATAPAAHGKGSAAELSKSADSHLLLGDMKEKQGLPLEAVREYQRAAEMEPTEPHLFALGAELLLHRALEPAAEVFEKGHRLYPHSARMLVGLGVTSYSRGSYEQAEQQILEACDLDPGDAKPYLFLGKIQDAEKIEPPGWAERLKRLVTLQPDNALASYYYAVALMKQGKGSENFSQVEFLLQNAIRLDAHLGSAYLQLGILYSQRKEFPRAISFYQQAIENTSLPDEAHFRMAEAYRQTGEFDKAREEIGLYDQISKQKQQDSERDRHEIQQFVYTLQGQTAPSQP